MAERRSVQMSKITYDHLTQCGTVLYSCAHMTIVVVNRLRFDEKGETPRLHLLNMVLLEDKAPTYLSDYCIPVNAVSSRHLRSVNQHQLTVPRCRRITFGHRAFSVAGPMVWNSLPTEFRDLSVGFDVFRRIVKTILFARY